MHRRECITVTFKLKNGKVKSRSYELPGTDEVFTLKKADLPVRRVKQKGVVAVCARRGQRGLPPPTLFSTPTVTATTASAHSATSQKAQEIIDTLKAETLTHTGDAMPVLRMEFSQQNNDDYYS